MHPVALGDPDEVDAGHVETRRLARVEDLGEPAQRAVRAVLEDHDDDGNPVAGRRPQRGDAVVGRAVTDQADHPPVGVRELRADRGGQPEAEAAGRREVVAALVGEVHLGPEGGRGGRRLLDVDSVGRGVRPQQREQLIRGHVTVDGHGLREVRQGGQRGAIGVRDGGGEPADGLADAGHHGDAHGGARGLAGVAGELDQPGSVREVPARDVLVVAEDRRTDHQDEVVTGQRVGEVLHAGGQDAAEGGVAGREGAPRCRRGDPHRRPELVGQDDRVVVRALGVDLRPQHQHRVPRGVESLDQLGELRRRQRPGGDRPALDQVLGRRPAASFSQSS